MIVNIDLFIALKIRKGNTTDYMAAYNLDNDFNAANDEFETMEMKPVIFDPQGNHGYLFGDEDGYGQDNGNFDFDDYPNRLEQFIYQLGDIDT